MNTATIKERPILFSAPMVRAIQEGRKTVTRRPIRVQPDVPVTDAIPRRNFPHGPATVDWYWRPKHGHLNGVPSAGWDFKCPYGQPGDRLWVRETWFCDHFEVMRGPYLKPDDLDIGEAREDGTLVYSADGLTPFEAEQPAWKPSIHMPRWASRILLQITDVRVERLHDITPENAIAEGVKSCEQDLDPDGNDYSPYELFSMLWTSINGMETWHANPWVWVVEFKRVTP